MHHCHHNIFSLVRAVPAKGGAATAHSRYAVTWKTRQTHQISSPGLHRRFHISIPISWRSESQSRGRRLRKTPPRGRETWIRTAEVSSLTMPRNPARRVVVLAHFGDVYRDGVLVKEQTFLNTHKRSSHTFIISLTELAPFSTWQLSVRYERWSDYETTGKKHKQQERHQKNRAGDTMTMNVCPVINISLHHCSKRRTKCKGEHNEKFIIFWHCFGIYLSKTKNLLHVMRFCDWEK